MKAGYTAPSVSGQAEAIVAALNDAGVDPESLSYVEAHGSATELGDPIELAALTKAFGAFTEKKNFCAVGSVKSNFGHLDRAALGRLRRHDRGAYHSDRPRRCRSG